MESTDQRGWLSLGESGAQIATLAGAVAAPNRRPKPLRGAPFQATRWVNGAGTGGLVTRVGPGGVHAKRIVGDVEGDPPGAAGKSNGCFGYIARTMTVPDVVDGFPELAVTDDDVVRGSTPLTGPPQVSRVVGDQASEERLTEVDAVADRAGDAPDGAVELARTVARPGRRVRSIGRRPGAGHAAVAGALGVH